MMPKPRLTNALIRSVKRADLGLSVATGKTREKNATFTGGVFAWGRFACTGLPGPHNMMILQVL